MLGLGRWDNGQWDIGTWFKGQGTGSVRRQGASIEGPVAE
jgi:hypothetical protein